VNINGDVGAQDKREGEELQIFWTEFDLNQGAPRESGHDSQN
jgi:hypothetical protein